jgi:universal stress protein E
MSKIERILVVVDAEEDYSKAPDGLPIELHKALRFVHNKASVELQLFSVGYERYQHHHYKDITSEYMQMRSDYVGRMKASLKALADRLSGEGFNIKSEVIWAHPRYEQIVKKADAMNADLVIQHVRAYAKIEHYHLTDESWQLVRHCPRPLLLVRDGDWSDPVVLMAAVDPMHTHHKPLQLDKLIMDTAIEVGGQLAGETHIVHAYGESGRPFAAAEVIKEQHSKAFDELVSGYNLDVSKVHFINETPLYALQNFTDQIHCNIIVMGAISRSRLSEALIGSTAEQALDYVKTDVLIVKPTH